MDYPISSCRLRSIVTRLEVKSWIRTKAMANIFVNDIRIIANQEKMAYPSQRKYIFEHVI